MNIYNKNTTILLTCFCFLFSFCFAQEPLWKKTNGAGGQPVGCLAIDSQNTIYAGGIYSFSSSKDSGMSWVKLESFNAKVIFISQAGSIFIGTDYGIWKSTDEGITWIHHANLPVEIKSFAFKLPNIIYCATANYGLYYTTNNGNTWQQLTSNILPWELNHIAVNRAGNLFAGAGSGQGIFRSMDSGITWEKVLNGITIHKIILASDSSIIASSSGTLLRSTDNGDSWEYILGESIFSFTISNAGVIYVGTYSDNSYLGGLLRSTDLGETWNNLIWNETRIYDIIAKDNTLYVAYTQGLGISHDQGMNWTFNSAGSPTSCVTSIDYDNDRNLYAAAYTYFFNDAGIYKSTDNGAYWNRIYVIPTSSFVNGIVVCSSDEMYYGTITFSGTINGGLFKSNNGSTSWTRVLTDEIYELNRAMDGKLFACGANGLYKYNENTKLWEDLGLNSSVWSATSASDNAVLAGVAPSNGLLLKYTEVNGVWQWLQSSTGLPTNAFISSLIVNSKGDVLAGTAENGIYYSPNNGDTWIPTSLVTDNVTEFLLLPENMIFAGSRGEGKVYKSTDDGMTWEDFSFGLPPFDSGNPADSLDTFPDQITSLTLLKDGYILAGTERHGLYKTADPLITSIENSEQPVNEFLLLQNYPNPFNSSTIINYEIPFGGFVNLKVYDVLGREIKILVSLHQNEGRYKINFNASDLPSGIYLYQLTVDNFISAKKLLLLK